MYTQYCTDREEKRGRRTMAECVWAHPCLYELKNANYMDQKLRDNIWKFISNNLNNKSGKYYTPFNI